MKKSLRLALNSPFSLAAILAAGFSLTSLAEDWPQWRGPNRDAKSAETGLLKEWPEGGPAVAWRIENCGVGYSAVAVAGGRIYTMGDLDGVEHILAFNEKDGSLLWAVQPEPVAAAVEARVSEQFTRIDKNADGKLDEVEALTGLGEQALAADSPGEGAPEAIAAKRVADLIKAFDKDGDGQIGPVEIPNSLGREINAIDQSAGARRGAAEIAEKRAATVLKSLDKDADGSVSKQEAQGTVVQQVFNNADGGGDQKAGDGKLTEDELKTYYAAREAGRDGVLTPDELTAYFVKRHPGRDGVLSKADLKRAIGGYRNGQGDGPRATPTVVGDRLYTEGGFGDVTCLDAATGKTIWHVNLAKDLGGGVPGWGYSESPLVSGNLVFVTPGGKDGTVAALNPNTGKTVWRSQGLTDRAHYASPVVAEIAGQKQVVQFSGAAMFGVSFDDGNLLWSYKGAANGTANCASPVIDGDLVLASSAYGTGGGVVRISAKGETQNAEEQWFEKSFANHHGGIVKVGDHAYGFGSNSLLCVEFKTGKIAWQERSVGKGSLVYADGHLYCLGESHAVALVEANPTAYVEKGRFQIETHGRPSWAHPVVANGRFYIRDQHTLTAYDVKAATR